MPRLNQKAEKHRLAEFGPFVPVSGNRNPKGMVMMTFKSTCLKSHLAPKKIDKRYRFMGFIGVVQQ